MELTTHHHIVLMLRMSWCIPPLPHTLSGHVKGQLYLYDSWTVFPRNASVTEASQESCGRKKRMKFGISMLQSFLHSVPKKHKKYFSCVWGTVSMWSIHTPSPYEMQNKWTGHHPSFADDCVQHKYSMKLTSSAKFKHYFHFYIHLPLYCSINRHCSPSNTTTIFVVHFLH
jgi:hypothetical protein